MASHRAPAAGRLLVLADDLSGATETAALLGSSDRPVQILLSPADPGPDATPVLVLDLNLRHASPDHIAQALPAALPGPSRTVLLKVDSLLRGSISALLAAAPAVLATGLPAQGRTVRDGVVHLDGVPMHHTAAWAAEPVAPPTSIAAAIAPVPAATVPLNTVRGPNLARVLEAALTQGSVPVCDSVTDADLDRVVAAAAQLPGAHLAGAGGLAAALGRATGATALPVHITGDDTGAPILLVVGSAAPAVAEQVWRCEAAGITRIRHRKDTVPEEIVAALKEGTTVLELAGPVVPDRARLLVRRLAATVAATLRAVAVPVTLVLTGGETARHVLDALGIARLRPIAAIHHGAVACRSPDGALIVTRPGSFGAPDSLLRIIAAVSGR